MTSTVPFSAPMDFKHMRHIRDIRGNLPPEQYDQKSIYGIIRNREEFSDMYKLLKIAGMEGYMDRNCANCTLVAAKNGTFSIPHGKGNAIRLIKANTFNRRIPPGLLKQDKTSVYPTMDKYTNILVENKSYGTILNGSSQLTGEYLEADNGLILVANGLCQPQCLF